MVPAQEGLERDHAAGLEAEQRLVVELEALLGDGTAQVELEQALGLDPRVHLAFEEAVGAAARRLRLVEREVGVFQQAVGRLQPVDALGDADAHADRDPVLADLEWHPADLDQAFGQHPRVGALRVDAVDDGELVAAEPHDRVSPIGFFQKADGRFAEQRVADRVPQRVVDGLEAVEVQAENGDRAAVRSVFQAVLELFAEQDAVRQAGQRVVARHVREAGLGEVPFGDVLEGHDPSAVGHGALGDGDDPPIGERVGVAA